MKNILTIENGIAILLSNVDDGTNTIFINGEEIPASSWVGSGVYQYTESGVTFTIEKTSANTGNIMLQLVSGTTYTLLKCLDSDSFGSGVYFGTCTTAAATAAKEVTLTNTNAIELKAGIIVGVKFSNSNIASNVTLNVNGTGAKSIYYANAVYTSNSTSVCGYANRTYFYMYDGTYWVFLSQGLIDNNTYTSAYCSTAAGTAAKTASCSGYNLLANSYIHIIMTTANTSPGALTLNIAGKGAKPIYINGTASSSSNYSLPAGSYLVYYNGTNYYFRTDGKVTSAGIVDIGGNTGKYAKGDGTWGTPTNTTYTFATGDSNGQIKVTPSGGTAQNVSVKGLGTAAYTASTDYAVSKTLTNENLNNVTTPGFYNAGGQNTCTNTGLDSGTAFGLEVVHTAAGSYYWQIINPCGTSNFYRRVCNNGTWSSWTQDNYTNTWRGIQNNLTSTSTDQSLSANQGRLLANGSARDSTKVSKSGDTMTGDLTCPYVKAIRDNNRSYTTVINAQNKSTTTASATAQIAVGNGTAKGTTGNCRGEIAIFGDTAYTVLLRSQDLASGNRALYLPASGTALATSASSSARVKENIRDMTEEEALKILDVNVVKFDYKEEYEDGLLDQSGVIAEEVLEIIPEVVTVHPTYDETKAIDPASNPSPTVDYGKFAPYLIKMIQMQQERIDRLESMVEELRR